MAKPAVIKTQQNAASVEDFLWSLPGEQQRADSLTLLAMMEKATGQQPRMWGTAIIGFGNKRYKSAHSGREVDWFIIGFSPRKAALSLYLTIDIRSHAPLLEKLGKYKTGVGCLYINKLADVNLDQLAALIEKTASSHT